MAVTFTAPGLESAHAGPPQQGQLVQRVAEIEVAIADTETAANVFQMIKVHDHETVYDVIISCDDIGDGTLVLDVGDGDVTDRFIDGSTIGQAGGTHQMLPAGAAAPSEAEFPRTYDGVDTIDITVQAASGTGVAGTLRLIAIIG